MNKDIPCCQAEALRIGNGLVGLGLALSLKKIVARLKYPAKKALLHSEEKQAFKHLQKIMQTLDVSLSKQRMIILYNKSISN